MFQPGTYKARVSDYGPTLSKGDAEQVCVIFEIQGHAGEPSPPLYCSFSDAALELSTRWLRVCGWPGDNPATMQLDKKRTVLVTIAEEIYDGRKTMRIVNVAESPIVRYAMPADRAGAWGRRIAARIALMEGRAETREETAAAGAEREPGQEG